MGPVIARSQMIILGIDPGSRVTGYSFLECKGKRIKYLKSGVLRFDHIPEFLDRISVIIEKTEKLLDIYKPDAVILESLIFKKSPTALIKLAQTRGAILATITQLADCKIFEYSPNLIKSVATGHGHADKEGVQKALDMVLGVQEYITHDASDATAVALCHALAGSDAKLSKKNTGKGRSLSDSLAHAVK